MKNLEKKSAHIAEFMGATEKGSLYELSSIMELKRIFEDDDPEGAKYYFHPSEMLFHSKWEWLMPVVEKILIRPDVIKFDPNDAGDVAIFCYDKDGKLDITIDEWNGGLIDCLYRAIVRYIKWYNKNYN